MSGSDVPGDLDIAVSSAQDSWRRAFHISKGCEDGLDIAK
jgi:hypothetical protein